MIIITKPGASDAQVAALCEIFEKQGLAIHSSQGQHTRIIGLVGDTSAVDVDLVLAHPAVATLKRVSEPYKKANRKFHPQDTVVEAGGVKIGGGHFAVMAGPCSVESPAQIGQLAEDVKSSGAAFLRGGAFKPRTSPYAFQGLRAEGLELLKQAKAESGLPIVSEVMDASHIGLFLDAGVDILQVGARNMQNFELLRALGEIDRPVLLKRGLSNTLEELLMSAEYVMAGGNDNVILCERGIRTFETATRNTFDISAIPMLQQQSHLPVIADPSHAAGLSALVPPLAFAAVAAGADGLMIEVHNDPAHALSDGAQCLTPDGFAALMGTVTRERAFFAGTR